MATRRQFIKWTAASGPGLVVGGQMPEPTRSPPTASVAKGPTPYLDPMPILADNAVDATTDASVDLSTALVTRKVHSQLPATTLFGYLQPGGPAADSVDASYLGPVILANSGTSVAANYTNHLAADDYLQVFTNNGSSYAQFKLSRPRR